MDRWLFLDSGPASGAENMALDEVLLERAAREGAAPALRLYSFDPPAITVGAHQEIALVLDLDAVFADGLGCARRITGGRALLHERELTYCVAAPRAGDFGGPPAAIFARIAAALAAALRSIGVPAEVSRGRETSRPRGAAPPCLSSTTRAELSVGGRKIAGSAQRVTSRAFLQHGSILLGPGSERIVRYVRGEAPSLEGRVTSVEAELGRRVDGRALGGAIADAFVSTFGAAWEPFGLSPRERREAAARAAAKERETAARRAGEVASP
jgi:lipoate-protein ligase A